MDHKSWLWRKKSSEKTIVVSDRVNLTPKGNEEGAHETDQTADLEKTVKDLNEKLSSAVSESKAKDDIVKQHAKVAEEAIAGWEKAESEAISFKQGLDNALQKAAAADDKIAHLDGAFKECMRQLRHVREEQEQRIHDAVMKVTRDNEREKIKLEEKLAEANAKAVELHAENNRLNKIIQVKEKLIEEIKERSLRAEADFTALSVRLDSAEKCNATQKYELCMLEKELEIRNEEKEYNRRAADALHKQQLESMKKITKLEAECQRLRLLVRKRLPGPAAVAQMKNEVETLGRDPDELRRKRFSQGHGSAASSLSTRNFLMDNNQDTISKRFVFLTERMSAMEEEAKILRENLAMKNHELESSQALCARTISKLTQAEAQLGQLLKSQANLEQAKSMCVSHASITEDGRNEDENSCAESWASALISELEQFKTGKPKGSCKSFGASELSLMDDFLEMEQLAIVSVDKPLDNSHTLRKEENLGVNTAAKTIVPVNELTGKELVSFGDMGADGEHHEIHSKCIQKEKSPGWLLNLLRGILLDHVAEGSTDEILKEIRVTLNDSPYYLPVDAVEQISPSSHSYSVDPSCVKSCHSSRSPPPISPRTDSYSEDGEKLFPKDKKKQLFSPKLNKSISKIIHIIEGAARTSQADIGNHQIALENSKASLPYKDSGAATGYTMRIFQWQTSELNVVLYGFIEVCNDVLQEKIGLEKFASRLCSTLDWIVNHCFLLQDVSSMKDTIKKHFDYDESLSESESETGELETPRSPPKSTDSEKHIGVDQAPASVLSRFQDNHDSICLKQGIDLKMQEEIYKLNDEIERMKLEKKEIDDRLQLAADHNDSLNHQIEQLDQKISSLESQLAGVKGEKSSIEDQLRKHRLLNDDLENKLSAVKVELTESHQKLSSLEVELEEKMNCLETLETTCLELQLQLESSKKKETNLGVEEAEKRLELTWKSQPHQKS